MGDPPSLIPRGVPLVSARILSPCSGMEPAIANRYPSGLGQKEIWRRAKPMTQGSGGGPDAHFRDRLENLQEYCSAVW